MKKINPLKNRVELYKFAESIVKSADDYHVEFKQVYINPVSDEPFEIEAIVTDMRRALRFRISEFDIMDYNAEKVKDGALILTKQGTDYKYIFICNKYKDNFKRFNELFGKERFATRKTVNNAVEQLTSKISILSGGIFSPSFIIDLPINEGHSKTIHYTDSERPVKIEARDKNCCELDYIVMPMKDKE